MSVKHIVQYFNQVAQQREDALKTIQEVDEMCANNVLSPERLEEIKNNVQLNIQPILENYMTLSYIMYLLNMPNKKEKQKKYVKQNRKQVESIPHKNTQDGVMEENNNAIKNIEKEMVMSNEQQEN